MTAAPPLLNPGHWRSLELLEQTSAVHQTLSRYEHAMGHPVYLRPTARGLTVLSLDPSAPAMIGVGGVECCIDRLPPAPAFVASATLAYRAKIEAMTRTSAEERHVIARIREALAHGLELGGGLLFLHQEWRFPTREKLDVLAVDSRTGQLVVIEAKNTMKAALHKRDARGRTASGQATNYAARLMAHAAEFMPFLQRLAVALGRIYRPDQNIARIDESSPPRCEVWWPTEAAPCCMGRRHATTAPTEDTARVLSVDTAE